MPTSQGAHFFVWDPREKKIIFDRKFPGNTAIQAIAAVNHHAYFVRGGLLMDYDSASRTLKPIYRFAGAGNVPPESLRAAKDGTLYGIVGGELVHIDPTIHNVRFFEVTKGHATHGLAIANDGAVYFGSGVDVWVYRPAAQREQPTAMK